MAKRDKRGALAAAAKILGSRGGNARKRALTKGQMEDIARKGGKARQKGE